ncbi:MAG: DNA primase, partial [Deltaproteobacteria bacterium]|nr:DNA primase [Deltaproteobacteria bacterium]
RRALEALVRPLKGDLKAFGLEIFPKQDQLTGKGLGNLVKLPLGVHRATGKPSYFIECPDRNARAQLEFLTKVKPQTMAESHPVFAEAAAKILVHPRQQQWADDFPELARLSVVCPPLGQIVATCRQDKTISVREEKIILQTVGFLPRAKTLVHHLMAFLSDYNP